MQLGDLDLADFIEGRMEQGVQIRTVKQTAEDYESASGISLKQHQVRKVMREQVGLRYRRIVRLAPQANSDRCLIQRQQCALVFQELFQTKRRIINIDE